MIRVWCIGVVLLVAGTAGAVCLVLPTNLPTASESEVLTSAATQITAPNQSIEKTLTMSAATGTVWTLSASPTITLPSQTGVWLFVRNAETDPTKCIVLRDVTASPSGSALDLGGSSRVLCGGSPALFLRFDGTNWVAWDGGMEVYEGVAPPQDKGMINRVYFDPTDFQLTNIAGVGLKVALNTPVTRLGNTIDPPEVACSGAQCFVLTGQVNDLSGFLQTFGALVYKDVAHVAKWGCGAPLAANDECVYAGPQANGNDIATVTFVNAHTSFDLDGSVDGVSGLLNTTYFSRGFSTTVSTDAQNIVPRPCATINGVATVVSSAWETPLSLFVQMTKNGVPFGETASFAANGSVVFSAVASMTTGDQWGFVRTCSGSSRCTSSSSGIKYSVRAAATCIGP